MTTSFSDLAAATRVSRRPGRARWKAAARALALATALTSGAFAQTSASHVAKIDPVLSDEMHRVADDASVQALVYFATQTDLDWIGHELDVARSGRKTRHETVVRTLRETAAATQAPILDHLEALRATGAVRDYEPFWIFNGAWVDATPAAIAAIAARRDVQHVYHDYPVTLTAPAGAGKSAGAGSGPEPGLQAIRVPEVWAQGYTGAGVLVASLDSGVDGAHPALDARWQGHDPAYAGHPEWAFFDPITNWTFPQDGGNHGTHTMGTVCGGLPGDQIGVAPGASWISAAVVGRGSLSKTGHIILALQWLLDPDGDPSTDADVPDVCNNSWTIGNVLTPPCDTLFWGFLDACEEAGIVMVFSAGNEGTGGVMRPSDRERTLAVAAIDAETPGYPLASFSSVGPTFCTPDGSPLIKPDISGPGVQVRSAIPGGGYNQQNGTSMAAPHLAGVVALMLEANPDLSVAQIKEILFETATDLGAPGKDNGYGWGLVDAYAAVQQALSTASLTFSFPNGLPELVDPRGGTTVRVVVDGDVTAPAPGTGKLHGSAATGPFTVDMVEVSSNTYDAVFPAFACGDRVTYTFSAETTSGAVIHDPPLGALTTAYRVDAYDVIDVAFSDDFETDQGWTVENGVAPEDGGWERAVPTLLSGTLSVPVDADGSGRCFLTGNGQSNWVDGTTVLVSPVMDPSALDDPRLSYWQWSKTLSAPSAYVRVDLSADGGGVWTPLEIVDFAGVWVFREVRIADVVPVTNQFRMRVVASNVGSGALDAAIDGVVLASGVCLPPGCMDADLDGNGTVGFSDLTQMLAAWGACAGCPEDLDGDDSVGFSDLTALLSFWGPCS